MRLKHSTTGFAAFLGVDYRGDLSRETEGA
jgi:hypothetical protein